MPAPKPPRVGGSGDDLRHALKGVAPILVFVLVMSSIANQRLGEDLHIKPILVLRPPSARLIAVIASFIWPTQIALWDAGIPYRLRPGGIA